jgi:hypothetical protein
MKESFALPGDGRKKAAMCEQRRVLWHYLTNHPKWDTFFKLRETILRDLANSGIYWSLDTLNRRLADLEQLGCLTRGRQKGFQGPRERRINKGWNRESAAPSQSHVRFHRRINIAPNRESAARARESAAPVAAKSAVESAALGGSNLRHRGFSSLSHSVKSEESCTDFSSSAGAENSRAATQKLSESLQDSEKKKHPIPPWVHGDVAETLWRGIHNRKIAAVFFDACRLTPHEQLRDCIHAAVDSVFNSRTATLMSLDADEVARSALQDAARGLAVLSLLSSFEARQKHTVDLATRTVIDVCLRMLPAEIRETVH